MPTLILASLVAAFLGGDVQAKDKPPTPVRVLLVTGVDHPAHHWKETAPALRGLLEKDGLCTVRIVEDPEVLGTGLVFDYDVVLLHFRNEKPLARENEARANLARLVKEGRGLVLIHFACGAFGDWPEFGELAGMIWDGKNTHDPYGPFVVHIADPRQPITRGLSDFGTEDELYIGLDQRRPVDVLAVARSKVTGRDHPMAFAFISGKGRVFHTPLGHDVKALQMPGAADLIRRGCQWAAGRTPTFPATIVGASGPLSVEQPTPYQWVVKSGPRTLCAYTFAPEQIKPYVRELAPLGGENVLRDSPLDHKHHHGLMFAIKVNGVNFWEETPGCGYEKPVGRPRIEIGRSRDGHPQALLRHRLDWVAGADVTLENAESAALLIEYRTLTVTLDESIGEVALHWFSQFKVGRSAPEVELCGTNYHGLGIRFRQDLDPLAAHLIAGVPPDVSGTKQDVSPGSWGAITFDVPGKPATVALFGSPRNPGGETRFFSMKRPFAYLSATPGLDRKPLRFKANDEFTFEYLVAIYPEIKPADFLTKRGEQWTARLQEKNP
jgi:type 1 glutamine amidotransferase